MVKGKESGYDCGADSYTSTDSPYPYLVLHLPLSPRQNIFKNHARRSQENQEESEEAEKKKSQFLL
jgi:hypothetical protein